MSRRSLYVETTIAADLDTVWRLTQDPAQHVRWDARFTRITPQHRAADEPEDFTYELRLPGLVLSGTGTSVGERLRADGTRTSALRFWSDSRSSPLRAGSGYWRYEQVPDGVRFLTGYSYDPGPQGRRLDDVCVRPALGWLTAWSFDRLRLWAETGLPPEVALRRTLAVAAVRAAAVAAAVRHRSLPWLLLASMPGAGGPASCPPVPAPPALPRRCSTAADPRHPRTTPEPVVTSIFADAMGSDFSRLHPELQRRFGVSSAVGISCVGRGVMDEIWRGASFTVPFLWLGAWRNILVPTRARAVPFTIENYAYVDSLGRETVTFNRTFELPGHRRARFDATMVRGSEGRIIDYLGTHQHLAVDLDLVAEADGSLTIRSGAQRFYEGPIAFGFPAVLTGQAVLHERFDDASGRFAVDVRVSNRRFGDLCGYRGTFTCDYVSTPPTGVPASAKPRRDEVRE